MVAQKFAADSIIVILISSFISIFVVPTPVFLFNLYRLSVGRYHAGI